MERTSTGRWLKMKKEKFESAIILVMDFDTYDYSLKFR